MLSKDNINLEDVLSSILDNSNQMVQVSRLDDFGMLYANKAARAYAAHGAEPYYGQPCYKYMMGFDEQCPFCPLRNSADGESGRAEVDNGKEVYAVKTKFVEFDGVRTFIEYAWDITQIRRPDKELEDEQMQVFNTMGRDFLNVCVVNVHDLSVKVLKRGNTSIAGKNRRVFYYNYYEMCRESIQKYTEPENRESIEESLNLDRVLKELEDKEEYSFTYQVIMGGEKHYCQLKYMKMDSSDNIFMGFRFIDEIIAQEKKYQEKLEKAMAAAEQAYIAAEHANQAKTTFLNSMSHDIRTPMNAILGFTALAGTHVDKPELVTDYLGKIMTASNHLLSLINDVLDMSRIESGRMKIEEKECNLSVVIHDLRNMLQADIKDKRLDFFIDTVDVMDENVICDRLRLNQILINILSNAIKFTNPGGAVSFRVIQKDNGKSDYADFNFIIKDNGIGMSEEFSKHVFEPFSREESSMTSSIPGTGLGLAITKNLVDMMNGGIEVESELGKGCTVTVSLRFLKGKHPAQRKGIKNLEGFRALVADDSTDACISTSKMLKVIGMRPDWTTSGKEAVVRAKLASEENDEYKVYIIDWLMPDMNGVEAVRRIRREIGNEAPIIILTAYDWSDIEDEAREAGVTAFCAKPLFLSELYNVLQEATEPQAEETVAVKISDLENFKGKRILLVEDVELNREIAETILDEAGIRVETATNGAEAVKIMSRTSPGYYDMILMDVMMPIMDGYEATRRIRKMTDPRIAGIPIIAMTANAFEEDRAAAFDAGMNEHLAKPFRIEALYDVMRKFL